MVYYRMNTKMRVWARLKKYKDKNLIYAMPMYNILEGAFAIEDEYQRGNEIIEKARENITLAEHFLKKNPQVLMDYGGTVKDAQRKILKDPYSQVWKFLQRQKYYIRKGYTESVAYEKAEAEFHRKFVKERERVLALHELARTNKMRAFLDHYQQRAEFESRLKVKQLARDLPKFLHQRDNSFISQDEDLHSWKGFNIVHREEDKPDKPTDYFLQKTEEIVRRKDEKLNRYDYLNGFTDSQILWAARDAPREMKQQAGRVLRHVTELGARLGPDGEVDVSLVEDKNIADLISENPLVKKVLQTGADFDITESMIDSTRAGSVDMSLTEDAEPEWDDILADPEFDLEPEDREESKDTYTVAQRQETVESLQGGMNLPEDQIQLQQETAETLRHLRKILDQSLIREGQVPVMGIYDHVYPNDGFTVDQYIDVKKMSDYLAKPPANSMDGNKEVFEFDQIKKLITPKLLVEGTIHATAPFVPTKEYLDAESSEDFDEDIHYDEETVSVDVDDTRMFGQAPEEEEEYSKDEDIAPSKKRQKKEAFKKARLQKALLAFAKQGSK